MPKEQQNRAECDECSRSWKREHSPPAGIQEPLRGGTGGERAPQLPKPQRAGLCKGCATRVRARHEGSWEWGRRQGWEKLRPRGPNASVRSSLHLPESKSPAISEPGSDCHGNSVHSSVEGRDQDRGPSRDYCNSLGGRLRERNRRGRTTGPGVLRVCFGNWRPMVQPPWHGSEKGELVCGWCPTGSSGNLREPPLSHQDIRRGTRGRGSKEQSPRTVLPKLSLQGQLKKNTILWITEKRNKKCKPTGSVPGCHSSVKFPQELLRAYSPFLCLFPKKICWSPNAHYLWMCP